MMWKKSLLIIFVLLLQLGIFNLEAKEKIKAVGIPLADHYAAVVAYHKYRHIMKYADYKLDIVDSPQLVRMYFRSEDDCDIAFTVAPMVIDMFSKQPDFKMVSLIHRDGNALAINKILNDIVQVNRSKLNRKPNSKVAEAFVSLYEKSGRPVTCGVPSLLATHTTIFYKYLKDNNINIDLISDEHSCAVLNIIPPPKAPVFLKKQSARHYPAAFEQSLPWPEIAETGDFGKIAWYSKDVMSYPKGHVECVINAKNSTIYNKRKALKEVIYYIHKAGMDIENAKKAGTQELKGIADIIVQYIPNHTTSSIVNSLNPELDVIKYRNLNIDSNSKASLKQIMDLAVEAGFLKKSVDIEQLTDDSFGTEITKQER